MKKFFILSAAIFLLAGGCNQAQPQVNAQPTSYAECVSRGGHKVTKDDDRGAGCEYNGTFFQSPPQILYPSSANPEIKPGGQTQTKDNASGPDYLPNGQKPPGNASSTLTVHQYVDTLGEADYDVPVGETAIELLKSTDKIESKDYAPGMGEFVESIDDVKPDSKHFWAFYVNGKSSNVGASSYTLKDGDMIEWKLEVIGASGE